MSCPVAFHQSSFARSLLASPSKEVAIVARISAMDASSNTGLNIRMETGMCPLTGTASSLKEELYKPMTVPEQDEWSTLKWGTHWSQASQAQSILMSSLPVFARASRSVSNMEKPWKQTLFFFYLLRNKSMMIMTNGLCNTILISIMRTKQSSIPVSIVIESLPGKETSELIWNFAKSFLMKYILNENPFVPKPKWIENSTYLIMQ